MAIKRYDVVAVTGTYLDAEGMEKRRYLNCGAVFENEKGLSLKLEALPVEGNGWFYLFEPRRKSASAKPAATKAEAKTPELDDDLPF